MENISEKMFDPRGFDSSVWNLSSKHRKLFKNCYDPKSMLYIY